MGLIKVISGGQTGVDRGALLAAQKLDFPLGGWYPKGSLCEDKINLGECFPGMEEHSVAQYPPRTAANVRDSNATLIIRKADKSVDRGTALTFKLVAQYNRLLVDCPVASEDSFTVKAREIHAFLEKELSNDYVLNVAGNRGSKWSEGCETSYGIVGRLIKLELNNRL